MRTLPKTTSIKEKKLSSDITVAPNLGEAIYLPYYTMQYDDETISNALQKMKDEL